MEVMCDRQHHDDRAAGTLLQNELH
jgi:hypothetical protein